MSSRKRKIYNVSLFWCSFKCIAIELYEIRWDLVCTHTQNRSTFREVNKRRAKIVGGFCYFFFSKLFFFINDFILSLPSEILQTMLNSKGTICVSTHICAKSSSPLFIIIIFLWYISFTRFSLHSIFFLFRLPFAVIIESEKIYMSHRCLVVRKLHSIFHSLGLQT